MYNENNHRHLDVTILGSKVSSGANLLGKKVKCIIDDCICNDCGQDFIRRRDYVKR